MGYLEKNIDCIKENRPDLYDRVKEVLEKEKYNPEKFEVIDTRDGDKAIQINEAGKTIRLNSLYSPKKEAERWVKQYKFDNIDVSVLMFGLANGAFANAIMNKMKDDAILIIMEPDVSLFIFCLNNFDMTGIISSDRVELYIDRINDENFYFCLHKVINSIMIPNQIICFYPEMEKLYYDKAKEFERAIQEKYSFDMLVAYGLDDVYRKGIDNTLKNLKFVRNSNYITELIGKVPEDVPVIIVAAGPSLSKNVEELKKAEGKAFIIATDTAVKTLLKHDIHYDIIVSIDVKKRLSHLEDERCHTSPMFVGVTSRNEFLEQNTGRKIWIITSGFMSKIYSKYGLKYPNWVQGGSVATDAFNIAKHLKSKRVIFVGQDLAYMGKQSHAGRGEVKKFVGKEIYTEDIYGGQVRTREDWRTFLYWFKTMIAELHGEMDVIDATEGGAKIEGSRIMTLNEAIDEYCTGNFDFKAILDSLKPTFDDEKYAIFKNDMKHMKIELFEMKKKAEEGIKTTESVIKSLKHKKRDMAKEKKAVKKIKKLNEFFPKQLVYSLLDDFIEMNIDGIMEVNSLSGDEQEDTIRAYELSKAAFESVIRAVEFTTPLLENALETL